MPKAKRLKLDELKIRSFVTVLGDGANAVKGGLTDSCTSCDVTLVSCITCHPCNQTADRTCGPECTMRYCW